MVKVGHELVIGLVVVILDRGVAVDVLVSRLTSFKDDEVTVDCVAIGSKYGESGSQINPSKVDHKCFNCQPGISRHEKDKSACT